MKEFQIDKNHKIVYNDSTGLWDYYKDDVLLSKVADKLFKFYSLSINNLDALLNNYFYLSNPSTFNDPFDCNINIVLNIKNEVSKLNTVKRNNIGNIGIASLTEVVDNHLMWAHYTNNYKGFAIEFKGDEISVNLVKERFEKLTLTRVIYPDKIKKIESFFSFAMHYVLTTKMKHWEYEKEWRMICQLKKDDDRVLHYYPEKVKAIYIGHRIIDEDTSAYRLLLEICAIRFPDKPIYVVYPHPEELELMFERVLN